MKQNSKEMPSDKNGSHYFHDGDSNANRNLWNQSSKLKKDYSANFETQTNRAPKKSRSKSAAKAIKNPRELALALAKIHKQGEATLGQRALLTVATVIDKKATDGQVRTLMKEAQRLGVKVSFKPKCMK